MTETAPVTPDEIRAGYQQIVPDLDPGSPYVARQLVRALLVSAMRRDRRCAAAVLSADEELSADEHAALVGEFAAVHLLHAMITGTGESVTELAAQISGAALDGGGISEILWEDARALGVNPDEVSRLAEAEAAVTAAARERDRAAQAADLDKAQGACRLLARVVSEQLRGLYAAWIDTTRGDMNAVRETVLRSQEDLGAYPDGQDWNRTETGDEWYSRTWDPETAGHSVTAMALELADARRKLSAVRELCTAPGGTVTAADVLEAVGPEPEPQRRPEPDPLPFGDTGEAAGK